MNASAAIVIGRAAPLTTIQDAGRFGMLRHGIAASGPMDRGGFLTAGQGLDRAGAAIEFTRAGLDFTLEGGPVGAGFAGGRFNLAINGRAVGWPTNARLSPGDEVSVRPGDVGNYGYVRFDREIDVPVLLGSRATNVTVGLGGLDGRPLVAGDRLALAEGGEPGGRWPAGAGGEGPMRFIWGIHADYFDRGVRDRFTSAAFRISGHMDRMGVRLDDPEELFSRFSALNLVSDAVVCGDVQIIGDGTPVVLMRDHQPTGGYPRIATIIGPDLDRFAQLRPGVEVRFQPVTQARAVLLARRPRKGP